MDNGAVWIIDEDTDDQEMVQEVWDELHIENELVFLNTAEDTLKLLQEVDRAPFMIICEMTIHKIDAFLLREKILEHQSKKYHSVPFIFWTTQASEAQVAKAYKLSAHGFFIKEADYNEMKVTFSNIINYWRKSKMPAKN